jgi:hypothetical protein
MKRKLVQILVVVLAAFALVVFVCPGDRSEDGSPSSQLEMLQASRGEIPAHPDKRSLDVDSPRFFATGSCLLSSSKRTTPPTLPSLDFCVLRC